MSSVEETQGGLADFKNRVLGKAREELIKAKELYEHDRKSWVARMQAKNLRIAELEKLTKQQASEIERLNEEIEHSEEDLASLDDAHDTEFRELSVQLARAKLGRDHFAKICSDLNDETTKMQATLNKQAIIIENLKSDLERMKEHARGAA